MDFAGEFAYYGGGFRPAGGARLPFRVDPNAVSVRLSTILDPEVDVLPYAPLTCGGCDAVFGQTSELSRAGWRCEYCGMVTEVTAEQRMRTQHAASAAIEFGEPGDGGRGPPAHPRTIFCVDMSGSMCVTEGFLRTCWSCPACTLKNELGAPGCVACGHPANPETLDPEIHLSRLEAVRHMIDEQLEILKREEEPASAGLVAFNDSVQIFGDGTHDPLVVEGDALHDYDGLLLLGEAVDVFGAEVRGAAASLRRRVERLKARGQTALGPALLLSVAAAGQVPGSKVVLCTDGLSNAGLGALSAESTDVEHEYASAFFGRVTEYAMSKGVYVTVVAIRGEQCNLAELGRLAQRTGGSVHRVRVDELTTCISAVTQSRVIATHVECRLVLHTSLEPYRVCRPDLQAAGLNSAVQAVPAATSQTEMLFQFGPASKERRALLPIKPSEPLRVPFQMQLRYRTRDGARRCRVLFADLPATDDLAHAEAKLDMGVLTSVATEASGLLALEGDMRAATAVAEAYSAWFDAIRAGGSTPAGAEALYDDYGSVVGMLHQLDRGAVPMYDSAAAGRAATLNNPTYQSIGPPGQAPWRQTDEVAEGLLQMTSNNRRRWRSKRLAECTIVEEVNES